MKSEKFEDPAKNPISPMSILEGETPSKLSRGNSPHFSEASGESLRQATDQLSQQITERVTEKLDENFAKQRQEFMAEQAQKFKEYHREQYYQYKGKAPQRPHFWGNKINKIVDHVPFDFKAKINYQYPKDISFNFSTDLIDAHLNLPVKAPERSEQPQQIFIKMDVPQQAQLVPAVNSLKRPPLPAYLVTSAGIAGLLFSAMLLLSSTTREQIVIDAFRGLLSILKKGAGLSLSTLRKGYNFFRQRDLNPEYKTFYVENNEGKKEVDILIIQTPLSLLPDEKKRGSVVVSNFSLFDNLIKVGSYGKITQIWRQDRFKLWKDENTRPFISEIVFNVAVPPSL